MASASSLGITQVQELGELETPILLTGTLSTWKVADATVDWLLRTARHGAGAIHQSRW